MSSNCLTAKEKRNIFFHGLEFIRIILWLQQTLEIAFVKQSGCKVQCHLTELLNDSSADCHHKSRTMWSLSRRQWESQRGMWSRVCASLVAVGCLGQALCSTNGLAELWADPVGALDREVLGRVHAMKHGWVKGCYRDPWDLIALNKSRLTVYTTAKCFYSSL